MNIKLQVRYEPHQWGMFAVTDVGLTEVSAFGATQSAALARMIENVKDFMAVQHTMPQPHEVEIEIPDSRRAELAVAQEEEAA
jgi:hypothetical protein